MDTGGTPVLRGGGLEFEIFVHGFSEGADVVGGGAAAAAEDVDAGFEEGDDAFDHFFGGFVVADFHVDELGLAGVGLGHDGEAGGGAVAADGFGGAGHIHAGGAVEGNDVGAVLGHEFGGAFGVHAHHGAEGGAVEGDVVGHGANDAGAAGFLGGGDAEGEFFEAGLGFDDDGVGAGGHEGGGLFGEGGAHLVFRELAVGFH